MKPEPIYIRDVQDFVRFLRETGEASLKTKNLPEREALQWGMQRLGPCAMSLIGIIERSGIPKDMQKAAQLDLLRALAAAYEIGSHGTVSKNTEVYIKAAGTLAGRRERAEKRAPADQRIREAITEAAKGCPLPPRRRGRLTWIDGEAAHQLRMKVTTVTSHRKKMLIV
jgi:hypothetical protein